MEKQITAVEWLEDIFWNNEGMITSKHLEQAKQMEKQQIINAWIADDNPLQRLKAEQYYNKTFKNK